MTARSLLPPKETNMLARPTSPLATRVPLLLEATSHCYTHFPCLFLSLSPSPTRTKDRHQDPSCVRTSTVATCIGCENTRY